MDILLFSDLHFHPHEVMSYQEGGMNSRLLDSYNVLLEIKDYAIKNNIQHIFFLGDFFHTRSKIDINVYNYAYEILEGFFEEGLKLYLIAGNHDMYFRNTARVTSLRPLSKIATVINTPTMLKMGNTDLAMFPYYEKPEMFKEAMDKMDFRNLDNLTFLLHAEFKGALRNTFSKPVKSGIDASYFPPGTFRVLMGHYHMQQNLNDKIFYLGSPIQVSMREIREQKYFYVLNTQDTILTPISTKAPKFSVVAYPTKKVISYWNNDASVEEAITGNYIEVRAFETVKKSTHFYKLLQKARNYVITNKVDEKEVVRSDAEEIELNLDDLEPLIDRYLKDHPFEKGKPEILNQAKTKIMEEANV